MREVIIESGKAYEVAHGIAVEFLGAHPTHWRVASDARYARAVALKAARQLEEKGRDPVRSPMCREKGLVSEKHGYGLELLVAMWLEREEFDRWGDMSLRGWIRDEIHGMHYSEFTKCHKLKRM